MRSHLARYRGARAGSRREGRPVRRIANRGSRKLLLPLVCVLAAPPFLGPGHASAITNGTVDEANLYPAVGAYHYRRPDGTSGGPCSGFLISSTAFVTSGHCAWRTVNAIQAIGGHAEVTFDLTFNPNKSSFVDVSQIHIHPSFDRSLRTDVAVLVLAEARTDVSPIELPDEGEGNQLRNGSQLTAVGYGVVQECPTAPGKCQVRWDGPDTYEGQRQYASETLNGVTQWFLMVGLNPNAGSTGGPCHIGDAGGPHLLPGTNTAVAVTTWFGSGACWSNGAMTRVDTGPVLAFLHRFID